jgi:hypothetical protein
MDSEAPRQRRGKLRADGSGGGPESRWSPSQELALVAAEDFYKKKNRVNFIMCRRKKTKQFSFC